ncbi:hypothetical protein HYN49_11130 [Flavobacterium pallidum]|uniref:Uncharacterized protein n=1 Tax=Flavobacterium pallidum TaxID=2172098 RepID=A0A2S1SJ45_9FLAO|nr:hypothetical protein HYN49_11130 [Flavobacterium pallidum]
MLGPLIPAEKYYGNNVQLATDHLPVGIYLVKAIGNNGNASLKIKKEWFFLAIVSCNTTFLKQPVFIYDNLLNSQFK